MSGKMDKPADFLDYKYRAWAAEYVLIYESSGENLSAANEWARENIPEIHRKQIKPYVEQAFEDRGYEL